MARGRRVRRRSTPPLKAVIEELDRYRKRGDRQLIKLGHVVRRPERESAALGGVMVAARVGRVERLYRLEDRPERVLVDFRGVGGVTTTDVELVKRSSAELDENGEPPKRRTGLRIEGADESKED